MSHTENGLSAENQTQYAPSSCVCNNKHYGQITSKPFAVVVHIVLVGNPMVDKVGTEQAILRRVATRKQLRDMLGGTAARTMPDLRERLSADVVPTLRRAATETAITRKGAKKRDRSSRMYAGSKKAKEVKSAAAQVAYQHLKETAEKAFAESAHTTDTLTVSSEQATATLTQLQASLEGFASRAAEFTQSGLAREVAANLGGHLAFIIYDAHNLQADVVAMQVALAQAGSHADLEALYEKIQRHPLFDAKAPEFANGIQPSALRAFTSIEVLTRQLSALSTQADAFVATLGEQYSELAITAGPDFTAGFVQTTQQLAGYQSLKQHIVSQLDAVNPDSLLASMGRVQDEIQAAGITRDNVGKASITQRSRWLGQYRIARSQVDALLEQKEEISSLANKLAKQQGDLGEGLTGFANDSAAFLAGIGPLITSNHDENSLINRENHLNHIANAIEYMGGALPESVHFGDDTNKKLTELAQVLDRKPEMQTVIRSAQAILKALVSDARLSQMMEFADKQASEFAAINAESTTAIDMPQAVALLERLQTVRRELQDHQAGYNEAFATVQAQLKDATGAFLTAKDAIRSALVALPEKQQSKMRSQMRTWNNLLGQLQGPLGILSTDGVSYVDAQLEKVDSLERQIESHLQTRMQQQREVREQQQLTEAQANLAKLAKLVADHAEKADWTSEQLAQIVVRLESSQQQSQALQGRIDTETFDALEERRDAILEQGRAAATSDYLQILFVQGGADQDMLAVVLPDEVKQQLGVARGQLTGNTDASPTTTSAAVAESSRSLSASVASTEKPASSASSSGSHDDMDISLPERVAWPRLSGTRTARSFTVMTPTGHLRAKFEKAFADVRTRQAEALALHKVAHSALLAARSDYHEWRTEARELERSIGTRVPGEALDKLASLLVAQRTLQQATVESALMRQEAAIGASVKIRAVIQAFANNKAFFKETPPTAKHRLDALHSALIKYKDQVDAFVTDVRLHTGLIDPSLASAVRISPAGSMLITNSIINAILKHTDGITPDSVEEYRQAYETILARLGEKGVDVKTRETLLKYAENSINIAPELARDAAAFEARQAELAKDDPIIADVSGLFADDMDAETDTVSVLDDMSQSESDVQSSLSSIFDASTEAMTQSDDALVDDFGDASEYADLVAEFNPDTGAGADTSPAATTPKPAALQRARAHTVGSELDQFRRHQLIVAELERHIASTNELFAVNHARTLQSAAAISSEFHAEQLSEITHAGQTGSQSFVASVQALKDFLAFYKTADPQVQALYKEQYEAVNAQIANLVGNALTQFADYSNHIGVLEREVRTLTESGALMQTAQDLKGKLAILRQPMAVQYDNGIEEYARRLADIATFANELSSLDEQLDVVERLSTQVGFMQAIFASSESLAILWRVLPEAFPNHDETIAAEKARVAQLVRSISPLALQLDDINIKFGELYNTAQEPTITVGYQRVPTRMQLVRSVLHLLAEDVKELKVTNLKSTAELIQANIERLEAHLQLIERLPFALSELEKSTDSILLDQTSESPQLRVIMLINRQLEQLRNLQPLSQLDAISISDLVSQVIGESAQPVTVADDDVEMADVQEEAGVAAHRDLLDSIEQFDTADLRPVAQDATTTAPAATAGSASRAAGTTTMATTPATTTVANAQAQAQQPRPQQGNGFWGFLKPITDYVTALVTSMLHAVAPAKQREKAIVSDVKAVHKQRHRRSDSLAKQTAELMEKYLDETGSIQKALDSARTLSTQATKALHAAEDGQADVQALQNCDKQLRTLFGKFTRYQTNVERLLQNAATQGPHIVNSGYMKETDFSNNVVMLNMTKSSMVALRSQLSRLEQQTSQLLGIELMKVHQQKQEAKQRGELLGTADATVKHAADSIVDPALKPPDASSVASPAA